MHLFLSRRKSLFRSLLFDDFWLSWVHVQVLAGRVKSNIGHLLVFDSCLSRSDRRDTSGGWGGSRSSYGMQLGGQPVSQQEVNCFQGQLLLNINI